jgi:mono/diheme cytochrome c family protein
MFFVPRPHGDKVGGAVSAFFAGGVFASMLISCSSSGVNDGPQQTDGASDSAEQTPSTPDTSPPTQTTADPTEPIAETIDPFADWPDTTEGLTNISADLDALLENGELLGACDRWHANPSDRQQRLLCGKYMFFYEGFGTLGIPADLLDFLGTEFPEELGRGFTRLGLVEDPNTRGRALGFGPGAASEGLFGANDTLAMTCASCHFGQLPDGRYAVGYPNLEYDYGTHMLVLFVAPQTSSPSYNPADFHPDAIAAVEPVIDALESDFWLSLRMSLDLLPLLGADQPPFGVLAQGQTASWDAGTMDFMIEPLPLEDGVHTVSKISHLWGIPTTDELDLAGMDTAQLAWTGSAESLEDFLEGFVLVGDGDVDHWTPEELEPLADYIRSLRPPAPAAAPPADQVIEGERVFHEAQCIDCHDGPRGSGRVVYAFEDVGTDDAMRWWADPDLDGVAPDGAPLTNGIKAPRLVGMQSLTKFLHNGSVTSLQELLCVDGDRVPITEHAFGNQGHLFGCDLSPDEKTALIHYLEAH